MTPARACSTHWHAHPKLRSQSFLKRIVLQIASSRHLQAIHYITDGMSDALEEAWDRYAVDPSDVPDHVGVITVSLFLKVRGY